jgi:hypothetical protein
MLINLPELLMRYHILILAACVGISSPAVAQHTQPRRDATETKTDPNSDAKAEETRQLIAKARERQKRLDKHNSDLWGRWAYAVCIGCGWTPKNVRIVHTNPSRVLIGIPAAEDDARELASMRLRI